VTGSTEFNGVYRHDRLAFERYCAEVFRSMPRADQRRSASGYLAGLVYLTGRRSARRMAAAGGGPADKNLQHFVNHSPWSAAAVRVRMVSTVLGTLEPTAMTIDEVAFAKHGPFSAGVDRQYSTWTGGEANCQRGVCLSMLGEAAGAPISWRLALPPTWDQDTVRRSRARVPDYVVSRPYWQHAVDLIDDLLVRWGVVAPAPLVIDMVGRPGVDPLVEALEARAVEFVIRVDPLLEVAVARSHAAPALRRVGARRPAAVTGPGLVRRSLADLARPAADRHRPAVIWAHGPEQRSRRSQFVTMALDLPGQAAGLASIGASHRSLVLVADWPAGAVQPRDAWLTNLSNRRLSEVVSLATSTWRSRQALLDMGERFGLFDHEGRTFRGWHHHVTLASAANVYVLDRSRPTADQHRSDQYRSDQYRSDQYPSDPRRPDRHVPTIGEALA
jgi:hypothetical protein